MKNKFLKGASSDLYWMILLGKITRQVIY